MTGMSISAMPIKAGDIFRGKIQKHGSSLALCFSKECVNDMDFVSGDFLKVTVKKISDGMTAEFFGNTALTSEEMWPMRVSIPNEENIFEGGDKVYFRAKPIDIKAWFESPGAVAFGTTKRQYARRAKASAEPEEAPDMRCTEEEASA